MPLSDCLNFLCWPLTFGTCTDSFFLHDGRDVHKTRYCDGGLEDEMLFLMVNFDRDGVKRLLSLFSDNRNELI